MRKTQRTTLSAMRFGSAMLAAAVLGCITVNVYFPEGAVQRAADEFVKDLYKSTDGQRPAGKGAAAPAGQPSSRFSLITEVYAADEINIHSPGAEAIKGRMAPRVSELNGYKAKGVIGETNNGTVMLKDAAGLSLKDRAGVERLIQAENKDRGDLYDEVQKVNNLNDRNQTRIRSHFSKAFQEHSPAGTWIQGGSGGWTRK